MSVRVRFAPSPTGPLHIGGVRTALYNYLFARRHQGTFILRIEDTDQTRYVEGAEQYIEDALEWLGLSPDESPQQGGKFGPYRQSERSDLYREKVQHLLDQGKAYYAFDSSEELDKMRKEKEEQGHHSPKYGHEFRMEMTNSLTLSETEVKERLDRGDDFVVRLLVQPGQRISFDDEVRGNVTFNSSELDDKVLMKSDGLPTYHLANVVDDRAMEITHVIRGEEWLSSTPIHVLLYDAFGWRDEMPSFVHLPLILKPSGKGKLSKRDGAKFGFPVFPLEWHQEDEIYAGFREMGFLPEATLNFLAFLGWNPGSEEELLTVNEMADTFATQNINKSGARFDIDKAHWFNQQYILATKAEALLDLIHPLKPESVVELSSEKMVAIMDELKPRMTTLLDFWPSAAFFFQEPEELDEKMIRKKWKENAQSHWGGLISVFDGVDSFQSANIESDLKSYMEKNELGFGAVFPLIRIALSGTTKGPDLFTSMSILGKEEVVRRMETAVGKFNQVVTSS